MELKQNAGLDDVLIQLTGREAIAWALERNWDFLRLAKNSISDGSQVRLSLSFDVQVGAQEVLAVAAEMGLMPPTLTDR